MWWGGPAICSLQILSPQPALHSCHLRPQRFGSGFSSNRTRMSGPPQPWDVDTQEGLRRAPALLIQAALWSPSPNEKDTILEAMAPGRIDAYSLAQTSSHLQLIQSRGASRLRQLSERNPHRRMDQTAQWRESFSKRAAFPIPPTRLHLISVPCHKTDVHSDLSSSLSLSLSLPQL